MKIRLKRIGETELRQAIHIAYQDDEAMRGIHILKDGTLDEMIDYTLAQSTEGREEAGTTYYAITTPDGTVIGHTALVVSAKLLFTFGINIHFRKKEVLIGWLKAVERHLGYFFVLTLRPQNDRAISFFKRNGFQTKEEPNQVILWRPPQLSQQ